MITPTRARARIAKIAGKFYDLQPNNGSFLQVARDLKQLGIKNWYFMLEIKDPSIVNIDPFAVDKDGKCTLTKEEISRITKEAVMNPWYYLRCIARIPDQGGQSIPYKANRGNIAQAYCIIHSYDSWLCLPRQKGKTQSALAIQAWAYNLGTSNSAFIFINKSGEDSKANLRRMVDQIKLLPQYLQFVKYTDNETGQTIKERQNALSIAHAVNKNTVAVKSQATSYEKALSLARGLTAPFLHFDEPEFTNHIKTIIENSVSTFEQAAANARRNGVPAARIFTCTPGDLDTPFGLQAQQVLDRTAKWTEKVYDWSEDEVQKYFAAQGDDCNKIFYIEYHYYQIGLNQQWLKEISAKIGNPLVVRREILLQRLHGSSTSPYDQEIIGYIVESEKKPIDELWVQKFFKFDVYEELRPDKPYIVGVDCATGSAGDNNAISIIDPRTVRPVAEFESSYIGETMFEKLLIELVQQHLPKAVLCIERNSVGDSVIDHLLQSPIADRLYYDKARDLVDMRMQKNQTIESMLKTQAVKKRYYGVWTGSQSRPDMFRILDTRVEEFKDDFITHNIIRDLSRLVRTKTGKVEAGPGYHDDSIMSYLIGLYVYYHGNNLSSFGIQKGLDENTPLNEGMKRADEINPMLVSRDVIDSVRNQERLADAKTYEEILREAMEESRQRSKELARRGLTVSEHYTPDSDFDADEPQSDTGEISMDFFSFLNGY